MALKDVAKFLGVDFTTLDDLPTDLEINYKQLSNGTPKPQAADQFPESRPNSNTRALFASVQSPKGSNHGDLRPEISAMNKYKFSVKKGSLAPLQDP